MLIVVVWLISFRFLIIQPSEGTHYHADFQIYLHGQLQAFDDASFYEEASACSESQSPKPASRVHMHDFVPHVIHVHDQAVTYSHFLSNLGFHLSDNTLETRQAVYRDGEEGRLRFILNDQPVLHLANRVIQSEDVLLIDFSNDDIGVLQERYQAIPRGAAEANQKQDPQSCLGDGEPESFWRRLRRALSFE